MNRRAFTSLSASAALAAVLRSDRARAQSPQATTGSPEQDMATAMARHAKLLEGPPVTIAMLPYPGMFLQDFIGPLTMFEAMLQRTIHIVWKDTQPLTVGTGIQLRPTTTFKDCPEQLDVLFVPGGVPGTFAMMEDAEVLDFLASRGARARWVTSVCTGSLILGAAGLLKGYKATSYWSTKDALKELGATPTDGRIVMDRNRITGGGVTAGLDFGLAVVAQLRSPLYAQAVQLYVEYDPQPPFGAGSPKTAPVEARQFLDDMFRSTVVTASETARRAARRLDGRD